MYINHYRKVSAGKASSSFRDLNFGKQFPRRSVIYSLSIGVPANALLRQRAFSAPFLSNKPRDIEVDDSGKSKINAAPWHTAADSMPCQHFSRRHYRQYRNGVCTFLS